MEPTIDSGAHNMKVTKTESTVVVSGAFSGQNLNPNDEIKVKDEGEGNVDGSRLQIEYDFPLLREEESQVSAPSTSAGDNLYCCEFCGYKTKAACHLQSHVRCHTGEKPYTCEMCDYASARKKDLKSHLLVHTGEKPFSCDQCNYKTANKVNLTRHMRTHTGEKPFACEHCKYKTGDQSALINHSRIHSNDRAWCCEFCDYKAVRRAHLLRHMRSHTGDHPFACDVCDYRTGDKDVLNRHKNVHLVLATDKKPILCTKCDFKATSQGSLKRHLRRAHRVVGEKPLGCHSCAFQTSERRILVRHIKTHSAKIYECGMCDYKSNDHSNMRTHKKRHLEGREILVCEECEFKTIYKPSWLRHAESHHIGIHFLGVNTALDTTQVGT